MQPNATQEELTSSLALHGWQVQSNKPAGGQWKATGKNQHGETIERSGTTPEMALQALLNFAMRHNQIRSQAPVYAAEETYRLLHARHGDLYVHIVPTHGTQSLCGIPRERFMETHHPDLPASARTLLQEDVCGRCRRVLQSSQRHAKSVSPNVPRDPNHDWNSLEDLGLRQLRAPIRAGEADDYIGVSEATRNATKVDTEWWLEDEPRQRLAIMNAFRVALLSPRKHLRWNAAHYQAIMHHDPSTPAVELWHTLESARAFHNSQLGYPEDSHLSYKRELEMLASEIAGQNPDLGPASARKRAKEIIFEKTKQFEEQIVQDESAKHLSELRRYNMARKMVADWLVQNYSPGRGWMPGQTTMLGAVEDEFDWEMAERYVTPEARFEVGDEVQIKGMVMFVAEKSFDEYDREWVYQLRRPGNPNTVMYPERMLQHSYTFDEPWYPPEWRHEAAQQALLEPEEQDWQPQVQDMSGFAAQDSKYGAFMGGHLDAIEQVGNHIEEIREAALEDLEHDGGRGFVFRNAVMNMNLTGVNPKVASFAWLLLAPLSSDLGIVDTHILRGLGYSTPNIPVRDYYKIERMEKAAKDASGYQHVPLGLYHWGLWDHIRNPGSHSDHSPLRVLDPQPWDDAAINWDAATTMKAGPFTGHHGFEATRPVMDQIARDFDYTFHDQPKNQVPDPTRARKRTPADMVMPQPVPAPAL